MTQTTTELLTQILDDALYEECESACEGINELHDRLIEGEPLPDQWRGKSDRDAVEAFVTHPDRYGFNCRYTHESPGVYVVTLSSAWQISFIPMGFTGKSLDEAYALATKWCREHP
jgi:hypothetical protein